MGSLLPKLAELLKEEYMLQTSIKKKVDSLEKEMKSMQAALCKVRDVPRDQLDIQVKLWAGEVRELSFDMEDVVDKFLVRVHDGSELAANSNKLARLIKNMVRLFTKGKARREIATAIKNINKQVQEVANRRGRNAVDNIVCGPTTVTPVDPRLRVLYTEVTELVGIVGKRDQELMKLLSEGDILSKEKLKIVSVVGFGGLGKTTLVKTVYDNIKEDFDCRAFVPVGRNADGKKVLMDILVDLGMCGSNLTLWNERQLINKLRESLQNKRYLIVIDDIWDEKLWATINLAFSKSNTFGSRLITTTRIVSVSKLCCSSSTDSVYQMEPLSDDDSKRLFYKRIFSGESGCPPEFDEVSTNILKKCGGVPLAIITIASLLASDQCIKPEDEWHVLLKSIGHGLTENPSVEEMMRIISFSYYDLPSHLKTCLLYLSMFPEDQEIKKDGLIWMWIAESFVESGNGRISLFEIGETYFNELVNKSMIQPVYDKESVIGTICACRVHDMVLDLICLLSREENFVTIVNGVGAMSSQSNVHRLSLQNVSKEEHEATPLESGRILQVRSIATFEPAIRVMPSFSSFDVLRVLDMTKCHLGPSCHLNLRELGSLFHLRYLGLASTGISKLPEEVGKLQFLQVLDLSNNYDIQELPSTISKLGRLMCLLISHYCKRFPDGLGNMSSMEVLRDINGDTLSIVKELGKMKRLRKLAIRFGNLSLELEEAFVKSLGEMANIQSVSIGCDFKFVDILGEHWVPPRSLREFTTFRDVKFSILPAWIRNNPLHLPQLSNLSIFVEEVQQADLRSLGKLPALCNLALWSLRRSKLLVIGADEFHCLTSFTSFSGSPGQVVFQPGALLKIEVIVIDIGLRVTREEVVGSVGYCFDLSMGNLPSLRDVTVRFDRSGVTVGEAKQAEVALGNTLRTHPNRPTFEISIRPSIPEDAPDGDVHIEEE
ncbi:Disease resistance RPP13-like protein 4 [Triticum urartu]|nr:Disease resistance RPP13-like protein 4 [Triticum urartu]